MNVLEDNIIFTQKSNCENSIVGNYIDIFCTIKNNSNKLLMNLFFLSFIPKEVSYVTNSLYVNKVNNCHINVSTGFYIGNLLPYESIEINYKIQIVQVPENNIFSLISKVTYAINQDLNYPSIVKDIYSNSISITVNSGDINLGFVCNKSYALVDDILTYSMIIRNHGMFEAINIKIYDLLTPNLDFIDNSIYINGVKTPDQNPHLGIIIPKISLNEDYLITFQVRVLNNLYDNKIINSCVYSFDLIDSKVNSTIHQKLHSNISIVEIESSNVLINLECDKNNVISGDIVNFHAHISNTGSLKAENILFKFNSYDYFKSNTNFISINNTQISNYSLDKGIYIGDLDSLDNIDLTFSCALKDNIVTSLIDCSSSLSYDFKLKLDPAIHRSCTQSNVIKLDCSSSNFTLVYLDSIKTILSDKPPISEIIELKCEIDISNYYFLKTKKGITNSGLTLTGNKLILNGIIKFYIEYISKDFLNSINFSFHEEPFSTFIILSDNFIENPKLYIETLVENNSFSLINEKSVCINSLFMINVKMNN